MLIPILFEDAQFVVVDKPPGVLSAAPIDAERDSRPTVQALLADRYGKLLLVHRLDVETTGVLCLAKTPDAQRVLTEEFAKHRVKKEYLAWVFGLPSQSLFKREDPIEGKKAITLFEVQERFPNLGLSLIRAQPVSGRRHQIRIHLQRAGYPVFGDRFYGGPTQVGGASAKRVELHCQRLGFLNRSFEAPWPSDWLVLKEQGQVR